MKGNSNQHRRCLGFPIWRNTQTCDFSYAWFACGHPRYHIIPGQNISRNSWHPKLSEGANPQPSHPTQSTIPGNSVYLYSRQGLAALYKQKGRWLVTFSGSLGSRVLNHPNTKGGGISRRPPPHLRGFNRLHLASALDLGLGGPVRQRQVAQGGPGRTCALKKV